MLTENHPQLFDGMALVHCAVMIDQSSPQAGWLFIPHCDGKWVTAAKLDPFSQKIIECWRQAVGAAETQTEKHTARQQFDMHMSQCVETPIERLRFFCSLAMNGQDWLDVEPFFDALTAVPAMREPIAWRNTSAPNGIKRFMTQKQYDANPKLQKYYAPVDCPKCDEWRASEHKLSEAYLRIRQKLNAFDTPHGPTADQVYEHTEAAIDTLQAKVAEQIGEIERLEKEVVHRQSLLRESNRNCAERAGIIWERNVTIAQQAVLIKKCEKAMPHNYVRMIEALAAIAEAKP